MEKKKQFDNHYHQCIYCKNIIVKIAIYLFDVNVHILSLYMVHVIFPTFGNITSLFYIYY